MRHILLTGPLTGGLLILSGCDALMPGQESDPAARPVEQEVVIAQAPPQEDSVPAPLSERPAASVASAEIDWASARADLAARPTDAMANQFQVASGADAPPVPVLLPSMNVSTASADRSVTFQKLEDGYFAAYPGDTYDIIVNGTNEIVGIGTRSSDLETQDVAYLATASGAQVSFSRYGADYLVEFECNAIDGATGTCISEEDAISVAREMVIAGTR